MSKYLFLKLGAFGDLSYFLPVLDQIQSQDPQAEITWIVGETYAELIQAIPSVHSVIAVHEGNLMSAPLWARLKEAVRLWSRLQVSYDQVWIGHRTLGAFLLLRFRILGKFYQVVRHPSRILKFCRNEVVVPPLSLHESLAFKRLAENALGKTIPETQWKMNTSWIPPLAPRFPLAPYIAVHLGGGKNAKTQFEVKQWPHWAAFLSQLAQKTQKPILLIGAPSEKALAQTILTQLSSSQTIHSLVGETSLLELLSLIQNSDLLIGVDSGPLHFADSLGIPCVGLYGPTSPISWGLLGKQSKIVREPVPCSPCYQDDGEFPPCEFEMRCMWGIQAEKVLQALELLPIQI